MRRGWGLTESRAIYFGHWQTLFIGSLAVAFGFAGVTLINILRNPLGFPGGVLAGAILGFVLHETAHREAARRQGCIAGFVLTPTGILITLLSGVLRSIGLPFAILAPGYVAIMCQAWGWGAVNRRDDLIAASGPAVNILLAIVALFAARFATSLSLLWFLEGFASINAWLAFFNLLPLEPLDGAKIMHDNIMLWIIMMIASILLTFPPT